MAPQPRQMSKACTTCKARRIKCDEKLPTCDRCNRSGRSCVYATDFDRVHRDETGRTHRRFGGGGTLSGSSRGGGSKATAKQRRNRAPQAATVTVPVTKPAPTASSSKSTAPSTAGTAIPPASVSASSTRPPPTIAAPAAGGSLGTYRAESTNSTERTTSRSPLILTPASTVAESRASDGLAPGDSVASILMQAATRTADPIIWNGDDDLGRFNEVTNAVAPTEAPSLASSSTASSNLALSGLRGNPPSRFYTSRVIRTSSRREDASGDAQNDGRMAGAAYRHPSAALNMPIGDMALCYFAANFMLLPRSPRAGGYFEYIILVLHQQSDDSALMHALRACAYSSMGNRWVSQTVNFQAIGIGQYTKALAMTMKALADPIECKSDATLATVLLLGLYEIITAKKQLTAWRFHIDGAVHIVRARGREGLKTRAEQVLFNAVRMQMMANALSSGTPRSTSIDWWMCENIIDSATARSQRYCLEVGHLRSEVEAGFYNGRHRRPADLVTIKELLGRLKAIESEVGTFLANMPASHRYATVAFAGDVPDGDYENAEIFPGRVDMYPDVAVAHVWNSTRACRIILSSLSLRCVAYLCYPQDYRMTPEYVTSLRTCNNLISDIIASAPFFFDNMSALDRPVDSSHMPSYSNIPAPSMAGFACGEESSGLPKALAGMLFGWPLSCIYVHDYATKAQRAYVHGRLCFIADKIGVRHARVYATSSFRFPSMLIMRDSIMWQKAAQQAPEEAKKFALLPE